MVVLSVLLKSEKVILAIVRLSVDRMSCETRETMNRPCGRGNV
jgi:hypothetical protein